MARPKKKNCDYFPHDNDMRNHRKIKALRLKYGIQAYALWVMFIEFLTISDNNIFNKNDLELELLSGDFGVSVTEITNVIDYCIRLGLLIEIDGYVYSESLNERLETVYKKRKQSSDKSSTQHRVNGKFAPSNTESCGVSVTEMPQSKVNKSKVNKKIGYRDNIFLLEKEHEELLKDFGKYEVDKSYDYLSSYKLEKSYKTKSDYLTIRRWVVEAIRKPNKTLSNKSVGKYQNELETARNAFKPISE